MHKKSKIFISIFKDPGMALGIFFVALVVLAGLMAPWLSPFDPNSQILEFRQKEPGFSGDILYIRYAPTLPSRAIAIKTVAIKGGKIVFTDLLDRKFEINREQLAGNSLGESRRTVTFWLGTDHFGRDILSRIIHGARISLVVGFSASIIALFMGVLLGSAAGIYGGLIEIIIMRFTDIMFGFPTLLFLIGITAAMEPSLNVLFMAIGFVSWPGMARLVRGQVIQVKQQEFIQSAYALGFNRLIVLRRHILPNCLTPIIVTFTLGIAGAIMAEASLSFLGLGAQPPTPSWGSMINSGKDFLRVAPWASLVPGAAIAIAVLGFNLLGDGLRDMLDPTIKNS